MTHMTHMHIRPALRPSSRTRAACWVLSLLAAAAVVLPACASDPGPGPGSASASAQAAEAGAQTLAQIESMIGPARCTADAQCRVAAIGSLACGGAESYRAWSTLETSAAQLEPRLQAYAKERQGWRDKVGLMSTCELRPAPGARCNRVGSEPGHCVLVPAGNELR